MKYEISSNYSNHHIHWSIFHVTKYAPFLLCISNSGIHRFIPTRVSDIEAQVKQQYGIPPKNIDDLPDNAMMNIKLL